MSKAKATPNTLAGDLSTSRRSVLRVGSALTAGLLLPLAGTNALASSTPETRIQTLWKERASILPECDRLHAEYKKAEARLDEATPPPPTEMQLSAFELRLAGVQPFIHGWAPPGALYEEEKIVLYVTAAGWRHAADAPLSPMETSPLSAQSWRTHFRNRARETLPIAERYEATIAEARVASGIDDAFEASRAVYERLDAIEVDIFKATPQTVADLLIQANLCEACGYADHDGDPDNDDAGTFPDYVARALLRSIKALAAQANA